VDLRSFNFIF